MTRHLLALAIGLLPAAAFAQPADRFEVALGGRLFGPITLDSQNATLTTADGGEATLFATDTTLGMAPALEGHVGVRLSRRMHLDAQVAFAFGRLETRITRDAEGTSDIGVSESIQQLTVGGGLLADVGAQRPGRRLMPFVNGGAAYLRQMHEGRPVVEVGRMYYAGGGLNVAGGRGTDAMRVGLRLDARVNLRHGGIAFDDDGDLGASAGLLLFFRF